MFLRVVSGVISCTVRPGSAVGGGGGGFGGGAPCCAGLALLAPSPPAPAVVVNGLVPLRVLLCLPPTPEEKEEKDPIRLVVRPCFHRGEIIDSDEASPR